MCVACGKLTPNGVCGELLMPRGVCVGGGGLTPCGVCVSNTKRCGERDT